MKNYGSPVPRGRRTLVVGMQQSLSTEGTTAAADAAELSRVLPCADCGGLDTALFPDEDGTFVLQETYRGTKDGDQTFADYGKWARTADKLVLTDSNGEKRYFRPVGKSPKCWIAAACRSSPN